MSESLHGYFYFELEVYISTLKCELEENKLILLVNSLHINRKCLILRICEVGYTR